MMDVKQKYIEYMNSTGHTQIPNVSLLPQNDSSLLFVNSGMFPLVPYLSGIVDPPSNKLFNVQRCARFNGREDDIEEVGDNRHLSFFHMLGNWSIGDYFKETQIPQITKFLVEVLGIDPKRLYVTVFEGDELVPKDDESIKIWKDVFQKYDIAAHDSDFKIRYIDGKEIINVKNNWKVGENNERIFSYPYKKNWWMRGDVVGELGGPDSEIFYDTYLPHNKKYGEICHVNCDCGKFVELGNNVFMQYIKNENGGWDKLEQKNVDFGGGLERLIMVAMGESDILKTYFFWPIIEKIESLCGFKYEDKKIEYAIIADHIRAAVFTIADGAIPSNKDAGYCVRRLIRRSIRNGLKLGIDQEFLSILVEVVIDIYRSDYPHLEDKKDFIITEIQKEEKKFANTIKGGLKELAKISSDISNITAENIFNLYSTYGFPLEMSIEEIQLIARDKNLPFDSKTILTQTKELIKNHQEISRAGLDKKFKGGLADSLEQTTRLHTAAHLFLESSRRVLGDHVHQKGSNITQERMRFDISHPQKISNLEIQQIENLVNKTIDKEFSRIIVELPTKEAFKIGAEGEFEDRYGDRVNVYKFFKPSKTPTFSVGITNAIKNDSTIADNFRGEEVFSFEICGGPHVLNTKELRESGYFKIIKEESVSAGIRRIKAVLA